MQNFQQQYPRKVITGSFDQDSLLVKRRNTYLLQNRAKNQRIKLNQLNKHQLHINHHDG